MATRSIDLPSEAGSRLLTTLGRALRRRCPYCGATGIFDGWFTLKKRCPDCDTLFEHEEGYFVGAYAFNLVITELATVALVIWLIAGTDWSVLRMQIVGITAAIAMPIAFYPLAVLIWIAVDITIHPPGDLSDRPLH